MSEATRCLNAPDTPFVGSGWLNARDMIPLTPEKIEQHLQTTGKKGGELTKAYKIARDPSDWKAGIVSRQIEYEQLQAAALEDHDELQSEEEPGSKKRKHKSDAGAKKTGADKKAKLSQPSKPKVWPNVDSLREVSLTSTSSPPSGQLIEGDCRLCPCQEVQGRIRRYICCKCTAQT